MGQRPQATNPEDRQDILIMRWWPDYASPSSWFDSLVHSEDSVTFNLAYIDSPELDQLIEDAGLNVSTNRAEAERLYIEAQQILIDEAYMINIFDDTHTYVVNNSITGVYENPAYSTVVSYYNVRRTADRSKDKGGAFCRHCFCRFHQEHKIHIFRSPNYLQRGNADEKIYFQAPFEQPIGVIRRCYHNVFYFPCHSIQPGNKVGRYPGNRGAIGGLPARNWVLDDPLPVQYINYLKDLLHGDLGNQLFHSATRFPWSWPLMSRATVELVLLAFVLAIIIGIPLGIYSAKKKNRLLDHSVRFFSIGASFPALLLGCIVPAAGVL